MPVAVKMLTNDDGTDSDNSVKFMREIEVMTLEHPAILSLVAWGVYEDCYCLVTRLMDKDIEKMLTDPTTSPTTRSIVALGVAAGMEFLHNNEVIHRDLKPQNVFLSPEGRPVVADFGTARFVTFSELSCARGTFHYMAPELFKTGSYDKSVDVFAWGMVFWRLITMRDLYSKTTEREMWHPIQGSQHVIAGRRPDATLIHDQDQRKLIESCWSGEPTERPSFTKILEHPEILMIAGCNHDEFDAYRREILNRR
jgi:serine/threonine protein kinase